MKKKGIFKLLLLAGCMGCSMHAAQAQVELVKEGKSSSRIIVTESNRVNQTAANILQDVIQRISGCQLEIKQGKKAQKGDIVIGGEAPADVKSDGFHLSTTDGIVRISGKDNGAAYGAVTLLEKEWGVNYWGEGQFDIVPQKNLSLPAMDTTDNPSFRYRQTQFYTLPKDTLYKWWYRLEEPYEAFAANYWVHTFDKLLPSDVYGKAHPEYYAYFKGKRHPGKASQWCLTNPEVLEIVAARIDSIFKANPDQKLICVSQNDGNYTNCTCPSCKKIDDEEGSFSGSLIHFINKLAARFPDKEIATLAYLYTMNPPKNIKPLPNVVIMLCDIDCKREVALTENASGQYFMKALEGWSAISNNLFVWDYGINFDNYLSPFPNFHILQPNIRTFRDHHVNMHFSQIASNRGGDFAELRTYLVSKLMWNPDIDVDATMQFFLNHYYGEAGHYIYRYLKMIEGALMGSNKELWIYDSPVTHKQGMLKPVLLKRYQELFDAAEKAVADNPVYLDRVQRSRLPLLYSELEILRTENEKDYKAVNEKLDYFEQQVKKFKVPTLNERSNSPVEYCELYRKRYMPSAEKNLAANAKITFLTQPTSERYQKLGQTALTDGLFGGATFQDSWVGWEGIDGSFIVDMGEVKNISSVETDFLHQVGAWILLPKQVNYSYSADGKTYTQWDSIDIPEERSGTVRFEGVKAQSGQAFPARYIKVEVIGTKVCPTWHYGVGHPCWFFIDEVTVK